MTTVERNVKPLEDTDVVLQSRTAIKSGAFYTWNFQTPIEINENAYVKVIAYSFEGYKIEANDALPYMIRMIPTSSTIKHPRNPNGTTVNEGALLEIAYDFRPASQAIELKLPSQQAINELTLEIVKTLTGNTPVTSMPEFTIVLKITEREPKYMTFGALNNFRQGGG